MAEKRWKHQAGDAYLPVMRYPHCSVDGPLWWETNTIGHPVPSIPQAIEAGVQATESDDFNIAVIRRGEVVGWLWGNEVVDDDPAFLAEMTQELRPWNVVGARTDTGDTTPGNEVER